MADPWLYNREPDWKFTLLNRYDEPIRALDGVIAGGAEIVTLSRLGGTANITLNAARRGEIDFFNDRVQVTYDPGVPGAEPWPVGVYKFTSPNEMHGASTMIEEIGLLTKMSVIDNHTTSGTYSLAPGTPVISTVRNLIVNVAGEARVAVTPSDATTSTTLVWESGESLLTIINDLLQIAGYRSLWCDGSGLFRIEPYVDPGSLSVIRTFEEGKVSIHKPDWQREQNLTGIPNRVVVISPGTDDEPAIVGIAELTDPNDPLSIPNRGVIGRREEVTDIESQAVATALAERMLFESLSPVARLAVTHGIVPLEPGDRVTFVDGGVSRDATVQRMTVDFTFNSQCAAEWRELS